MQVQTHKQLENGKTQCLICPRNCQLQGDQQGFCQIRKNINGKIILDSYGYTTGVAIDPIEKKPLYHFYPSSKVLSFGTLGCNMGCLFCQNWHMSKAKMDKSALAKASPKQIVELAKEYNCKSVAFTYNDPIIFFEYAIDTAKLCREQDIKTVAVTAGYINPEPRAEFFKYMDAANVDLKGFSDEFYKKYCLAKLEPVLETLKYIKKETSCHLEVTTLLIPDLNDSDRVLIKECEWILENLGAETPLHFSAFHPAWKMQNIPPTAPSTLFKAYNLAKQIGLKHVYTGNIIDNSTSATYCSNCDKALIKRTGYLISEYNLDKKGNCKFCGTKCYGKFE